MTKHYNKSSETEKRRLLRQNQTYLEEILQTHLRNRKCLGIKFRRQYSIDQYVIDFYSPEIKLAIELDGNVHNEPNPKAYDVERQKYIERFGVSFCRITNEEYEGNQEKAFKKIENLIPIFQQKVKTKAKLLIPVSKNQVENLSVEVKNLIKIIDYNGFYYLSWG